MPPCRCPPAALDSHPLACLQVTAAGGSSWLAQVAVALQQRGTAALVAVYPYVHACIEGIRFFYQLSYLLDVLDCHSPTLHLLGQRLVRLSGAEMVSGMLARMCMGHWAFGRMGVCTRNSVICVHACNCHIAAHSHMCESSGNTWGEESIVHTLGLQQSFTR